MMGYHGTSVANANKIIKTKCFQIGKRGWLGTGVYFFENDANMAVRFYKNSRNRIDVAVITCKIEAPDDKILDVTSPDSAGAKEFHSHRENFIEAVYEHQVEVTLQDRNHLEEIIYDDLCDRKKYQIVRAYTYTYSKQDRAHHLSSHVPNGIELCVRNISLISDMNIFPLEYVI
jgi:hypothetical protein